MKPAPIRRLTRHLPLCVLGVLGAILGVLRAMPVQARAAESSEAPLFRLSLTEVIDRARASSARVGQILALEFAASAALREANAHRVPEVDLTAGYTRNSNVPELTIPIPGDGIRTIFPNLPDNYRSRLAVSLPIYTGGRVTNSIAASKQDLRAAESDTRAAGADLDLETALAYWSLVSAREDEKTLREAIASYEAHLKESRDREQAGMAARNEVLAVQVDRDRAELSRLRAATAADVGNANRCGCWGCPRDRSLNRPSRSVSLRSHPRSRRAWSPRPCKSGRSGPHSLPASRQPKPERERNARACVPSLASPPATTTQTPTAGSSLRKRPGEARGTPA